MGHVQLLKSGFFSLSACMLEDRLELRTIVFHQRSRRKKYIRTLVIASCSFGFDQAISQSLVGGLGPETQPAGAARVALPPFSSGNLPQTLLHHTHHSFWISPARLLSCSANLPREETLQTRALAHFRAKDSTDFFPCVINDFSS